MCDRQVERNLQGYVEIDVEDRKTNEMSTV